MKFFAIDAQSSMYSVIFMCAQLGVSRAGFYAWKKRKPSQRETKDQELAVLIRAHHAASRGTYGSPRILKDLQEGGLRIGRRRVMKIMRKAAISGKRKARYVYTTDSKHEFPVAKNVLDRKFKTARPNEAWVGDLTYISTGEGWLYLAVLMDLYSRKIVGWALSSSMGTDLPLRALDMAIFRRRPDAGLIHHTDRGSQYASKIYRRRLEGIGARCSMSRRADCWDNAPGESVFSRIKDDLVYRTKWDTRAQASAHIEDYIENFYNATRRHSANGNVSPENFENAGQPILFSA